MAEKSRITNGGAVYEQIRQRQDRFGFPQDAFRESLARQLTYYKTTMERCEKKVRFMGT
jgi:hypothetical protein